MSRLFPLVTIVWLASRLGAGEPYSPASILSNVLARAEYTAQKTNFLYTFTRINRQQAVDEKEPEETKVYIVTVQGTNVASTLTRVNETAVPPEKQRPERRASDRRRNIGVTPDLLTRYDYSLAQTETVEGVNCYKLSFRGRDDAPEESIVDKLLNRLAGELWVDIQSYEIVRLNVRLIREASVWGGIAGALSIFNLTLTKTPLHPDLWVNKSIAFEVKGRKLLSGFHLRSREECADFSFSGPSPFLE